MGEDAAFCELVGLPFKEYELNGCAIGIAQEKLPPRARPTVGDTTTWLE
jgi:hypothetical protein